MEAVFIGANVKRNVLIQWFSEFRIKADSILGRHTHTFSSFIQMSRLFSKTIEMVFVHIGFRIMSHPAKLVFIKGSFLQICVNQFSLFVVKPEAQRFFLHDKPKGFRLKYQFFFLFFVRKRKSGNPLSLLL